MFNSLSCSPTTFSYFLDKDEGNWTSLAQQRHLSNLYNSNQSRHQIMNDLFTNSNLTQREQQELVLYWTAQEFGNFTDECQNLFFSDPPEFYRKCITLHFYATFLYSFIVDTVIVGSMCLFGIFGNLLSFIVLSNERSITGTNFLLRCLCLADSIFLSECFLYSSLRSVYPLTGWLKSYYHIFPFITQYLWPIAMTTQMIVNWLVVMVTSERYIVVCKPFQAPEWCSKQKIKCITLLMILFVIIYNIPRFFEWKIELSEMDLLNSACFNYTRYSAQDSWLRKNLPYRIIYRSFLYIVLVVLVPILLLICLNIKLISTLKEARRDRMEMTSPIRSTSKSLLSGGHSALSVGQTTVSPRLKCITESQQKSITLVIVVICTVFIICETPGMVHNILASTMLSDPMEQWPLFFYTVAISNALMVAKSSSNFIIYCCCGRKFRYILQRMLARWSKKFRQCRQCNYWNKNRVLKTYRRPPVIREAVLKLESRRVIGSDENDIEEVQNLLANKRIGGWVEENQFAREADPNEAGGSGSSDSKKKIPS